MKQNIVKKIVINPLLITLLNTNIVFGNLENKIFNSTNDSNITKNHTQKNTILDNFLLNNLQLNKISKEYNKYKTIDKILINDEIQELIKFNIPYSYTEMILSYKNDLNKHYFKSITEIIIAYNEGLKKEDINNFLKFKDSKNNYLFSSSEIIVATIKDIPFDKIESYYSINETIKQDSFYGIDIIDAIENNIDENYIKNVFNLEKKYENLNINGRIINQLFINDITINDLNFHLNKAYKNKKEISNQILFDLINDETKTDVLKNFTTQNKTHDSLEIEKINSSNMFSDKNQILKYISNGGSYKKLEEFLKSTPSELLLYMTGDKILRYQNLNIEKINNLNLTNNNKPNALIIYPLDDYNNAFYNNKNELISKIKEEYNTKMIVAQRKEEIYSTLKNSKDLSLLILAGHGQKKYINLDNNNFDNNKIDNFKITTNDYELFDYLDMKNNGKIFLFSCNTGMKKEKGKNLANFFIENTNNVVYSSKKEFSLNQLKIDSIYPFRVMIRDGFDNLTYTNE
ncbi:MAG: DUF4347 domain-containing protein [Candidatus Woesearchaeota archaeon]